MLEMTDSCKEHRDTELVCFLDSVFVADAAAWLDYQGYSVLSSEGDGVVEGQEAVRGENQAIGKAGVPGLVKGDFGGADAVGLAGADADGVVIAHDGDSVGLYVLYYLPAEVRICELSLGGLNLSDTHFGRYLLNLSVKLLGKKSAVYADILRNWSAGAGHIHLHHAKVLLRSEYLQGLGGIVGSDYDLEEYRLHAGCDFGRKGTVHSYDSAVDADLIGLIGGLPRLFDSLSDRCATGIHMLQSYAEGLLEVAKHVQSRICVLDIVVGELLALDLLGESEREGGGLESGVELRALVGVLAVAKSLLEIILQEEFLVKAGLGAHIGSYAGVVLGGMCVSLCGQFEAGLVGSLAVSANFFQDLVVVRRIADDSNVFPVLGCAANHRRAADIDILNRVFKRNAFLGDSLTERIQVYTDQFDSLDSVLLKGLHMGRDVPAGKDTAVDLRMEGLYPAVAYLRETGDLADSDSLYSLGLQQFLSSAGGYDFPSKVYQTLHKRHEAALVANTY